MPDYEAILYEVRDGVATITLNRPEAANSLNHQISTEMLDALIRSEENPEIRALVLTGAGRFFCAGADLKSFYVQAGALKDRVSHLHVALSRIVRARFQ
ncbi:MAG: enoyl-CoA hydratase/isomerase family protein [Candidatus Binataceae bacterium]